VSPTVQAGPRQEVVYPRQEPSQNRIMVVGESSLVLPESCRQAPEVENGPQVLEMAGFPSAAGENELLPASPHCRQCSSGSRWCRGASQPVPGYWW